MSSYLRWLTGAPALAQPAPDVPDVIEVPPEDDDDSDTATERGDNDDEVPAFPSLNSAQRLNSSNPTPRIKSDSELMPPPALPNRLLTASSSTPGGLALPPSTTRPPPKPSKKREKVALAPGHSPLDWAILKSSGTDLRGVDALMRIPPSVLKQHNKKDDAWSAFHGKVYNITPYMAFHPGGERDLMRVAGRDGTKLFMTTHSWVNADLMLDACMVGFLVPEPSD